MKYNTTSLSNGLRVIHLASTSPVVYCGYEIAAGSACEGAGEEGLAHFCEHVTFKGTERRNALQIINTLERVGGSTTIPVDVRLVAATNRDLKAMVKEGTFREDLYFRLNVVNLQLPPLREHPEDIPELLTHFLHSIAQDNGRDIHGFTQDAMNVLQAYRWPGNIRELRNCVERMVVMTRGNRLTVTDIPREIVDAFVLSPSPGKEEAPPPQPSPSPAEDAAPQPVSLDIRANELAAMKRALEQAGGNRTRAAEILGISRRTLQRRLLQHPELEAPPPQEE